MRRETAGRSEVEAAARGLAASWWIFLITGVAWLILGKIVFDADLGTVAAIGTFAGFILIFAGFNEFLAAWVVSSWKLLHATVGVLMIVAGVFAFIRPEVTFLSLAAILGWYLLFKGILDIITALADRTFDLWWVGLIVGTLELLIGLWAAGYPGRSVTLLIVWVGASAVTRGVMEIVLAFRLRSLRDEIPPMTAARTV
jgi:uncharacterized membrane protein HdeD (DUF308 family)